MLDAGYDPALPEYKTGVLPNELIQHDKSNNVVAMTEFHSDFIDARPAVVTRPLESCVRPSYDGKYPCVSFGFPDLVSRDGFLTFRCTTC